MRRSALPLLILVALAVGGAAGEARQGQQPHDGSAYAALVARWIADQEAARSQLLRWSDQELRAGMLEGRAHQGLPRAAAAMLHTELALEWVRRSPGIAARHLALAEEHVQALAPGRPEFRRGWLLLRALDRLKAFDVAGARALVERALGEWPEQPELLLTLGVTWELDAKLTGIELMSRLESPDSPETEARVQLDARQRHQLGEAERCYRRTLERDPDAREARLRLARILLLLGEREAALPELDRVAGSGEDDLRYLALLLGARTREREARPELAEAGYRAALDLSPGSQAARIGLAALLQAGGEPEEAAALLEEGFAVRRADPFGVDPWWLYPQGRVGAFDAQWRALVLQARAP